MTDKDKGIWSMITTQTIQALREFQREYFHALRNGKSSDEASDQAIERVKQKVLAGLRVAYPTDETQSKEANTNIEITRMEKWGDVLIVLVNYQILLRDLPIDQTRLNEIPSKTQA